MSNQLDSTLVDIDFKSLYHMAEWHEKQATIFRTRAHQLQRDEHRENTVALRVEFLRNTPKTVMRYLKQGHSAERACQLAADHTNVPLLTIISHWERFLSDKSRKSIKQRDYLIFEMHGLGLKNVNIADRLNLHEVTVCRILKKEKEKRLVKNPNPERIAFFAQREQKKDILPSNDYQSNPQFLKVLD